MGLFLIVLLFSKSELLFRKIGSLFRKIDLLFRKIDLLFRKIGVIRKICLFFIGLFIRKSGLSVQKKNLKF